MRSAALLLGVLLLCVGPLVGRAAEVPATPDPADLPGIYDVRARVLTGDPIVVPSSSNRTAADLSYGG